MVSESEKIEWSIINRPPKNGRFFFFFGMLYFIGNGQIENDGAWI